MCCASESAGYSENFHTQLIHFCWFALLFLKYFLLLSFGNCRFWLESIDGPRTEIYFCLNHGNKFSQIFSWTRVIIHYLSNFSSFISSFQQFSEKLDFFEGKRQKTWFGAENWYEFLKFEAEWFYENKLLKSQLKALFLREVIFVARTTRKSPRLFVTLFLITGLRA